MFSVRIEPSNGVAICRIEGEVDAASTRALREAMTSLSAFRSVVLDFSGVPFIDSAGLGAVIAGARRIRGAGGDIVLCSPRKAIGRLLTTVGMDRVLHITDALPDALEALRERRSA